MLEVTQQWLALKELVKVQDGQSASIENRFHWEPILTLLRIAANTGQCRRGYGRMTGDFDPVGTRQLCAAVVRCRGTRMLIQPHAKIDRERPSSFF